MSAIHSRRDASTLVLTLSNPGKLNAISVAMWQAIERDFRAAHRDNSVRLVVVQGEGGDFAAGADVDDFASHRHDEASGRHYHEEIIRPALQAIIDCDKPVIAVVEGVCVGGGLEIAACCDLRLAAEDARIGVPVGRMGFPLAPFELGLMHAVAGRVVTLELLLEGRLLSGIEAAGKGLVTRAVPRNELAAEIERVRAAVLANAPLAIAQNKQNLRRLLASVANLNDAELAAQYRFFSSADYHEGVAAFLAKRAPVFTGT